MRPLSLSDTRTRTAVQTARISLSSKDGRHLVLITDQELMHVKVACSLSPAPLPLINPSTPTKHKLRCRVIATRTVRVIYVAVSTNADACTCVTGHGLQSLQSLTFSTPLSLQYVQCLLPRMAEILPRNVPEGSSNHDILIRCLAQRDVLYTGARHDVQHGQLPRTPKRDLCNTKRDLYNRLKRPT